MIKQNVLIKLVLPIHTYYCLWIPFFIFLPTAASEQL